MFSSHMPCQVPIVQSQMPHSKMQEALNVVSFSASNVLHQFLQIPFFMFRCVGVAIISVWEGPNFRGAQGDPSKPEKLLNLTHFSKRVLIDIFEKVFSNLYGAEKLRGALDNPSKTGEVTGFDPRFFEKRPN